MGNKLDLKIRGFIIWRLENYMEDKKQLEEYRQNMIPSATSKLSLTGGVQGGGVGKPTENAGIRLAEDRYIQSTERSIKAIEAVLEKCDEIDRRLIERVYIQQRKTTQGEATEVNLCRSVAFWRVQKVLIKIAEEMGIKTQ